MSEYKFRGKRIDNEQWVYGNLITVSIERGSSNPKFTTGIQVFKDAGSLAISHNVKVLGEGWD